MPRKCRYICLQSIVIIDSAKFVVNRDHINKKKVVAYTFRYSSGPLIPNSATATVWISYPLEYLQVWGYHPCFFTFYLYDPYWLKNYKFSLAQEYSMHPKNMSILIQEQCMNFGLLIVLCFLSKLNENPSEDIGYEGRVHTKFE